MNDMKSETAFIFLINRGWALVSGKLIPPVKKRPNFCKKGRFSFFLVSLIQSLAPFVQALSYLGSLPDIPHKQRPLQTETDPCQRSH